ncbi:MAG: heme exporter protein CcmD [Alphaproteobacteria bacterium]|nr:heme exporter protein CcmD [Alphaproteobacteria bacterium]MCZ6589003.1 heme exporter protein CcmD [Alphaproteobacteria bacterium]MCZ6592291.1 heme exporter protein CcmD [Alphaproteobacteria bacterium]MCZ6838903.1 heme exporter protein CcmD [Alphaproteobacteria bacterium]
MEDITTFLNMGGYAAFVWPALGLTAVILILMAVTSTRQLRANEAALQAAEKAGGRHRRSSGSADQ